MTVYSANLKSKNWWVGRKFGKLTVIDCPLDFLYKRSEKYKVTCLCSCGNKCDVYPGNLTGERIKSCGKCNWKPKEWWLKQKPYNLKVIKFPYKSLSINSTNLVGCRCNCGNITKIEARRLFLNKTCGKCNWKPKEWWIGRKFGELTVTQIKGNGNFKGGGYVKCKCSCGNTIKVIAANLTRHGSLSCGKCNWKPKEWWVDRRFGKLTVINCRDKQIAKNSEKKNIKCKCSCGNIIVTSASYLTDYKTNCGKCRENTLFWWDNKKSLTKDSNLSLSNLQKYFKGCSVTPIEGNKWSIPSKFKCNLCGKLFKSRLSDVVKIKQSSCGCITYSVSKHNLEVAEFLQSLGLKVKKEKKLDRFNLDIFCNKNLVIEINGLRFHNDITKEREERKYEAVKRKGYKFLMFFEDEWVLKQQICKNIIKDSINLNSYKAIRPQKCNFKSIPNKRAKQFYDKYHIQGGCNSTYNIGVFFEKKLLACMSIRKPSRPNSGDWEISRMCSRSDYKIHGVWSYIVTRPTFKERIKGKLVTFSDNRLFNGNVCAKMNMIPIKQVKRDYYWTKGLMRINKSSMRKTSIERQGNKTEFELRTEQGFQRIWDLGKIKWQRNEN